MHKILVADKLNTAGLERLEAAADCAFDVKTGLSKDELLEIIGEYDGLIVRSATKPDADIIKAGTNLKIIGRAGIGVDNIDIAAATDAGVIVMNTPAANSVATAEQALALMLAVSRHTALAHQSMLEGRWDRSTYVGTELRGKTLGVIGFGQIGRLTAQRAQAFAMRVIAFDPYVSEADAKALDVELVELDDLLAQSDYITLHTKITDETTGMINAANIAKMKNTAILVNTARGKLVNEADLADALQNGGLRAAALDVYHTEPPEGSPLIGLPNVLHTPHLAASTVEAQEGVATEIVDQMLEALRGQGYRNALNLPFNLGPDFAATRPFLELAEKLGVLQASLTDANIAKVELEVRGNTLDPLVRSIASAFLQGLLTAKGHDGVNFVNAPLIAKEQAISMAQANDIAIIGNYPTVIACRVTDSNKATRLVAGVLFADGQPRIVQMDDYSLEAKPEGVLLVMKNKDVPGVIGQVGTLLSAYQVNIGEWRMGRVTPGQDALSFINLDSLPSDVVVNALVNVAAVTEIKIVSL